MNRSVFAGVSLLFFAACATSPEAPTTPQEPSKYELAMGTVDSLVTAGNEQIAIDRLTQLLGDPGMSDAQMADALLTRAELRFGDGNDVEGALEDLYEILGDYPQTPSAEQAEQMLSAVEVEEAQLSDRLSNESLSPMERFRVLFRLGHHQKASDIMLASALQPENRYILDLYQIGYLCDAGELAGPTFQLTEPDGTQRNVQFCSLGK